MKIWQKNYLKFQPEKSWKVSFCSNFSKYLENLYNIIAVCWNAVCWIMWNVSLLLKTLRAEKSCPQEKCVGRGAAIRKLARLVLFFINFSYFSFLVLRISMVQRHRGGGGEKRGWKFDMRRARGATAWEWKIEKKGRNTKIQDHTLPYTRPRGTDEKIITKMVNGYTPLCQLLFEFFFFAIFMLLFWKKIFKIEKKTLKIVLKNRFL